MSKTVPVSREALQQRIRNLANKHGYGVYQEKLVMVITSDGRLIFLLCLGDDDDLAHLPREQITALARMQERGIQAKVVWPRDWPEVARMITTGDWRN